MPIKLLEPQLANQIAAGEVVERPASVVKELIENSIDAGADRIELNIEKGGHKRIKITDNGSGIGKDELTLALSRHATSKITTLDDLENILSLGFRGEALASISSVSRLTLTSKPATQEQAWQAHCEGRDMAVKLNPAAHPDGTTIDVADLFYNTPARRKFLRTEKTEFQHIEDVVKRIALSHPDIAFLLTHNGKVIRRYPVRKDADRTARIAAVAGNRFVDNAVYTKVDYDGICLEAWLGNENVLRSSPDCQFSFVNGRGMRDKLILHAIRQAYESVWGVIEQPSFVVYLQVPPKDVDVNVHPAKHEVRFQQSRLVHDFIVKSVASALNEDAPADKAHSPSEAPAHDYIRPLSPGWSEHQSQARESNTSIGNAGFSTPRTSSFPTSSRSSGNNSQAARHYQTLMSTAETQDNADSASHFLPLTHSVRLYVNGDNTALLRVEDITALWMQQSLATKTTSQPLLMPVSVASGPIDKAALARFAEWHMVVAHNAGKVRLQQVPAGTRHWPWTSWFGLLTDALPATLEDAVTLFVRRGAPLPDAMTNEVWQWFEQQPQQFQWETAVEFGKVRAMDNLVDLLSQ